ncbi:MAG TPA: hypothetical protein VF268_09855 [Gammaproteobacteria bacterium]|jgi:hypothetical protein
MASKQSIQKQEQILIQGYDAVLKQVAETTTAVSEAGYSIRMVFKPRVLREATENLDACAERLRKLDQRLSSITRLQGDIDGKLRAIRTFSTLFDKGNVACISLCQGYRAIHQLKNRQNLYVILGIVVLVIAGTIFSLL